MRIDVVSIFPRYLDPLDLSLSGKAREKDLLDLRVHDLRAWTHDRHHTVDDTPYGGGAGMVMKPEPWGEALDEVLPDGAVLVVPTPSGTVFTQAAARELTRHDHLVIACGRYEGIDQRVLDHARTRADVREPSSGRPPAGRSPRSGRTRTRDGAPRPGSAPSAARTARPPARARAARRRRSAARRAPRPTVPASSPCPHRRRRGCRRRCGGGRASSRGGRGRACPGCRGHGPSRSARRRARRRTSGRS